MIETYHQIIDNIAHYSKQTNKPTNSVQLLAVSKTWAVQDIEPLIKAGQCRFGENYLQEALIKIQALKHLNLEWHFIGPIQSNKTKDIATHFDWVQSIDRLKIAHRLNEQRPEHLPPLNICIQVNIDNDEAKSGINSELMLELAAEIQPLNRIKLRGLMILPAQQSDLAQQQNSFCRAQNLFESLQKAFPNIDTLSMGMSNDMKAAILAGSTMVRIGTALFGNRAHLNA